jgi:hypothetical protein
MGIAAVSAVGVSRVSTSARAAANARVCSSRWRPHVRIGRLRLVVDEVADEPVALDADDAPGGGGVVAQAMGQRHPDDLRAQRGERVDGGVVRGLPFQR